VPFQGADGGYLPLSCVLTAEPVYEAFYAEYQALRAFLHSHSYTATRWHAPRRWRRSISLSVTRCSSATARLLPTWRLARSTG